MTIVDGLTKEEWQLALAVQNEDDISEAIKMWFSIVEKLHDYHPVHRLFSDRINCLAKCLSAKEFGDAMDDVDLAIRELPD